MRQLTPLQKARAAECLGMAFSHHRVAQTLIKSGEHAAAISKLYFAAYFAAKAACIELCKGSKKHAYWIGQFNKNFGQGQGWVPKSYAKLLNDLSRARSAADYDGTFPNDRSLAKQWEFKVSLLLKKVRAKTPLLLYPEFIESFLEQEIFVFAVEFDYYCPKSYIHKERIQFQCMSEKFSKRTINRLKSAGASAVKLLKASRLNDYALGWNSRLGQSGDGYLLFLDIDELDESTVKAALKGRKGWLFKTGQGFHFIGSEVYPSIKAWRHRYTQAAKSKKLKNLIDMRHVDFSLRRGYSTVRIDKSAVKDFIPFMCWDNSK